MKLHLYEILTIIILLSAIFSYVNHRFIKWPQTVGIMAISLMISVLIAVLGSHIPILRTISDEVSTIDFQTLLMKIMLGFLLFAGAFHINAVALKKQLLAIITLAGIGTLLSTFIIGGATFLIFSLFNISIPFIYCLLFGSLISPTDPIAVLGILKSAKIPSSLELKISGESLFNDGVAVVIFLTIFELATIGTTQFSWSGTLVLFGREAIGGLIYGSVLGYIGYLALKSIDNYQIEVLITIALVMAGYMFADVIHVSGPLAMVIAGIITGNLGKNEAMSDVTRDYVSKFWELVDEILNAVLFMLMGLEMLIIKVDTTTLSIGLILIVVALAARWLSIALPLFPLRKYIDFEKHATKILTWGGLRGGISVALALSLPQFPHREKFIAITYIIVVFSILVQGLTIGKLAKKLSR